jgi:enoyl-CoA hydratase
MRSGISYTLAGGVGTITMDDGKVNALSPHMLGELNAALDRAEAGEAAVVLTGRSGVFSAGFDLAVLRAGDPAAFSRAVRRPGGSPSWTGTRT